MTVAATILLGAAGAMLLAMVCVTRRSPAAPQRRQPAVARELYGLQEDLRSGDIDRDAYDRSRDRLAARLAATEAPAAARERARWRWPAAGVLTGALIVIALVPAVRQRGPADSPTGNDFGDQATVAQQAVADVRAAERALNSGDAAGAVSRYRRALAIFPERTDLRARFGLALLRAGRVRESLTQLQLSASRAPRTPTIRLYLGAALVIAGRRDEAAAQWRRFLDLTPSARDRAVVRQQLRRLLTDASRGDRLRSSRAAQRPG